MTKQNDSGFSGTGRLRRAAEAVTRVFRRSHSTEQADSTGFSSDREDLAPPERSASPPQRTVQRPTDIPLDVIDKAYTPPRTSSKASFRSDGADHQLDQEFALGVSDGRWKDEDRYTNKSGDPRIGTHGRTYERDEERRNND